MKSLPFALRISAFGLAATLALPLIQGQESSSTYTPKPARESQLSSTESTGSFNALRPIARQSTPLRLGAVEFRPGISYSWTDAKNLLRSVGNNQDSEFQTINLNLNFNHGEFWTFNYSPSWTYYSNDNFDDNDSHSASFSSDATISDWRIGFSQTFRDSNGSLVQTGTQTEQESWGTTLSGSRQLSSTFYLDLSGSRDSRSTSSFSDVKQHSFSGWIRHQASTAVNSSAGITWGYADVDTGLDTEYMQFLLRFGFNPTDKLSASLQGGIDSREVDLPGASSEDNPTYSASLQYQPFDYTTVGVSLSRRISASYFSNQNSETESLSFTLRQRLLGRFFLTASYGENSSDYLNLLNDFTVGRVDDYESFSHNLSATLVNRISMSIFYRDNKNATNAEGFDFSSEQTGIRLGFRY